MSDATQDYMMAAQERIKTGLQCQRDARCARDDGHAELCIEANGSVILRRRATTLTGDHHEAYLEFVAAAQALDAHQRAGAAVTDRYKTAVANLSRLATKEP